MKNVPMCEVDVFDRSGEPAFTVHLYGVSVSEMMTVPPAVSIGELLERRGLDPAKFISSPFHVRQVRRV